MLGLLEIVNIQYYVLYSGLRSLLDVQNGQKEKLRVKIVMMKVNTLILFCFLWQNALNASYFLIFHLFKCR